MEELFNKCELCPRKCMVNRNIGEIGYKAKIPLWMFGFLY
jgi:uncharacterized Fe-S radical SAM superfamily protein PflX